MNFIRVVTVVLLLAGYLFPKVVNGGNLSSDTSRTFTHNGDLASVSYYKNGLLQFKKIYWQSLPNGQFVFVSEVGFITVKNGFGVTLDSLTPDNIIEITIDKSNNVVTYIWKSGKRELYTGGEPDGTQVTKYEGDNPGVYEWQNGKLKFIRKLSKKDLAEKESSINEDAEILKMLNLEIDTTKHR